MNYWWDTRAHQQSNKISQRSAADCMLGVVSKGGPRVRKEVPKASSRVAAPEVVGIRRLRIECSWRRSRPRGRCRAHGRCARHTSGRSTFPYPSSSCCCLPNRQFLPVRSPRSRSLTAPVSGSVALTASEPVCSRPAKNSVGVKRTTVRSCRRRPSARLG
jgi:hypothetical protein